MIWVELGQALKVPVFFLSIAAEQLFKHVDKRTLNQQRFEPFDRPQVLGDNRTRVIMEYLHAIGDLVDVIFLLHIRFHFN